MLGSNLDLVFMLSGENFGSCHSCEKEETLSLLGLLLVAQIQLPCLPDPSRDNRQYLKREVRGT